MNKLVDIYRELENGNELGVVNYLEHSSLDRTYLSNGGSNGTGFSFYGEIDKDNLDDLLNEFCITIPKEKQERYENAKNEIDEEVSEIEVRISDHATRGTTLEFTKGQFGELNMYLNGTYICNMKGN